ncbi:McrB family protein [Mucilaginibacter sp. OK098]|uniref:McrB family protein n=1 Tax=Mucilaginibacter sp. OK098 TaxID=1855297 RepID=UPI0009207CFD|nr:AAA family ATPase [Mucilaginibacter sp. OK098]SHN31219.1 AAA domain (dynein-related subfamily) [Mucilaginibacter sp. OK098]
MKKIKLYDVHGVSATSNYKSLITDDEQYFYWDNKRFINYLPGDVVFWINRLDKEVLYTEIDKTDVVPTFKDGRNLVIDGDYHVFAKAQTESQFEVFYRFKILKKIKIIDGWSYTDTGTFSAQLMAYILYEDGVGDAAKRISKIDDLIKLFTNGPAFELLNAAKNLLLEKKTGSKSLMKEPISRVVAFSPKEIVDHIHEYLNNRGFKYHYEEIANFFLALKTKPFIILAGISGTGKTQLPRMFAQAIGMKANIIQVPVRPDWTDGSDLLGYTSLDGKFVPKNLTIAIEKANLKPNEPHFFILDEMNLARVEHYFSDFLSIIETREWTDKKGSNIVTDSILSEEVFQNGKNSEGFKKLGWPKNLYLIGTVNMDETTHAFSRKVLDRANSIEMNDIDLDWIIPSSSVVNNLSDVTNSFLEAEYLMSIDLSGDDRKSIDDEINILKKVNKILQTADMQFAYRVRDEIAFYLILNKKYNLINDNAALDFQLVQKILPRIHGSSERIQRVLIDLLNLLEGKAFKSETFSYLEIEKTFDDGDLKYRRSIKKILFMLKRFDEDRFTSFWL